MSKPTTLSTTLSSTDAWYDQTTITVTWVPQEIRTAYGEPLSNDGPAFAHASTDDPPVEIGLHRTSGTVVWDAVTRSHSADTWVVTCFGEVERLEDLVPGTYHVRVHGPEADDEDA